MKQSYCGLIAKFTVRSRLFADEFAYVKRTDEQESKRYKIYGCTEFFV